MPLLFVQKDTVMLAGVAAGLCTGMIRRNKPG
jgi:hypothetical protein